MSQILRHEKKPGDVLTADDYNIDMELPSHRIRVYKENITLNTQTSPEVEIATVQFDRSTYISYLLFFRQIMEDVVIKNLNPTETVAVELNTWLMFRDGGDVVSESIPNVTIYDIPPGGTITIDITNNDMYEGIFYTIDNILIKMYIRAYIQSSGADTDAEVFIPRTWMLFEL